MTAAHALRALTVAGIAMLAASCSTTGRAPRAAAPAAALPGEAVAARACAGCHAVGRQGASANTHAPAFRELARLRTDADLARTLAAISRVGHVEMPPIYMTPQDQTDLVRYLRTLRGEPV